MDDLIKFLKDECIREPLIGIMHCLLHADDTAIISTNRELFTTKCNKMLSYFGENCLTLNLAKSSYMILNGKEGDIKNDIHLENGSTLEYKSSYVYLGAIITDTGNIKHDVEKFIDTKRSNVTIKYNNFIRKNTNMPLKFKLSVLDSCVSLVLTYGCETWGSTNISSIETAYRLGLKRALSVRESTCSEIVYVESCRTPLRVRVTKQQLSFWNSISTYLGENPEHPLNFLIEQGERINLKYLKHYRELARAYTSPEECQKSLVSSFTEELQTKIRRSAAADGESKLGVYLTVNPEMSAPSHEVVDTLEIERIMVTRYRCGSHYLRVETGRWCYPKTPRNERLCECYTGVQTLHHCLFECPLFEELYSEFSFTSVEEAMATTSIAKFIMRMEQKLGVSASYLYR